MAWPLLFCERRAAQNAFEQGENMEEKRPPLGTQATSSSGTSAGYGTSNTGTTGGAGRTGASTSQQPFGTTTASETADASSGPTVNRVMDQAHDVVDQLKDTATEQAHTLFDAQKGRVVDGSNAITTALRQTATSLRQQDQAALAGYVEQATSKVEEIARNLEQKDLDTLLWDVRSFARRSPALFFGATFAVGFLASRFLKSSSERHAVRMGFTPPSRQSYAYEPGFYGDPFASRGGYAPYPSYGSGDAMRGNVYGSSRAPRSSSASAAMGGRSTLQSDTGSASAGMLDEEDV
jgi:hypothetical protein